MRDYGGGCRIAGVGENGGGVGESGREGRVELMS